MKLVAAEAPKRGVEATGGEVLFSFRLAPSSRHPLRRAEVLKQHPHQRPNRPKKSYAPLVHAASRKVRLALYEGYRAFVAAYREAADRLRAGDRAVIFPAGSFPPALPFVGG